MTTRLFFNLAARACLTVSVCVAAGCGEFEEGDGEGAGADTDATETVESALWYTWSPLAEVSKFVGMAISTNSTAYAWKDDGWGCRGEPRTVCDATYPYSAPNNVHANVRAVAINGANWVYYWFKDKTYSIGDSATPNSRYPGRKFSCAHQMDQLIDAFNASDNALLDPLGRFYYYWRAKGSDGQWHYWRTVGTADVCDKYEGETQITVDPSHGDIVGIDFRRSTNRVYTWYRDGYLNTSTSKMNLGQI